MAANAAVGEVEITLGDKSEVLRSSLAAARQVSQIGGGFLGASARVAGLDFDAIVAIVAVGLGVKPSEIEQRVFETAVTSLSGPVSTFVTYLANGGKPPKEDNAGTGEA